MINANGKKMIRAILFLILFFGLLGEVYLQENGIKGDHTFTGKENTNVPENYKTLINLGLGYGVNNNDKTNFYFSFDIIPKISKSFFLDFKIDGFKQDQTYNVFLNFIPEYKLNFTEDNKFSAYFGTGPTLFFYPKGHPGIDASITFQLKIEYALNKFFVNTEVRKPLYFSEDSGQLELILNLNFGIKM
jgi:hypothetical protein